MRLYTSSQVYTTWAYHNGHNSHNGHNGPLERESNNYKIIHLIRSGSRLLSLTPMETLEPTAVAGLADVGAWESTAVEASASRGALACITSWTPKGVELMAVAASASRGALVYMTSWTPKGVWLSTGALESSKYLWGWTPTSDSAYTEASKSTAVSTPNCAGKA